MIIIYIFDSASCWPYAAATLMQARRTEGYLLIPFVRLMCCKDILFCRNAIGKIPYFMRGFSLLL